MISSIRSAIGVGRRSHRLGRSVGQRRLSVDAAFRHAGPASSGHICSSTGWKIFRRRGKRTGRNRAGLRTPKTLAASCSGRTTILARLCEYAPSIPSVPLAKPIATSRFGAVAAQGCGFPLWVMGSANSMGRSVSSWFNTPERDACASVRDDPVSQGLGPSAGRIEPGRIGVCAMPRVPRHFADDQQRLFAEQTDEVLGKFVSPSRQRQLGNRSAQLRCRGRRPAVVAPLLPSALYGLPAYSGMDSPPHPPERRR